MPTWEDPPSSYNLWKKQTKYNLCLKSNYKELYINLIPGGNRAVSQGGKHIWQPYFLVPGFIVMKNRGVKASWLLGQPYCEVIYIYFTKDHILKLWQYNLFALEIPGCWKSHSYEISAMERKESEWQPPKRER